MSDDKEQVEAKGNREKNAEVLSVVNVCSLIKDVAAVEKILLS